MEETPNQLEALHHIRRMMQDSSRFLSLSGLSGVFAGAYALAGEALVYRCLEAYKVGANEGEAYRLLLLQILGICVLTVALAMGTSLYLSYRKALKNNKNFWGHASKNMLESIAVPMLAGGLFCLALLWNDAVSLIIPAMLLFYGMALVNSSKFTWSDIKSLGYLEMLLGLGAAFYPQAGLVLWGIGFGILHIFYGVAMWFKYDR